jgi:GDPmannose 4,6-dehydratase
MKNALITGITGQDGAYLAKFLLEQGYKVYGTYRRLSTPNFWRLIYLDIFDKVELLSADLIDSSSMLQAIETSNPNEIYHLAAQSFVDASFDQPIGTGEITGLGVTKILEAIRHIDPHIRFYQASTSELFGNGSREPQNENSPFYPSSPYSAAKIYGYWITRIYRESYGIFASNGILFNHESPLRGMEFVTRKITNSVARIKLGIDTTLELGNLKAKRDWGYAPEYVQLMWQILQQDEPDDFVIATGETHSIEEFVTNAFDVVGLDWQKYVKINHKYFRPVDVNYLQGDCAKAKRTFGWEPKVKFNELVELMVLEDVSRWERWLSGERFAWDAPNYPTQSTLFVLQKEPLDYFSRKTILT